MGSGGPIGISLHTLMALLVIDVTNAYSGELTRLPTTAAAPTLALSAVASIDPLSVQENMIQHDMT